MLQKVVYAGSNAHSFLQACQFLDNLAHLKIGPKQVERLTERIGRERVEQRDEQTKDFLALALVEKFSAPDQQPILELAVVMADGGRLQIWDDHNPSATPPTPQAGDAGTAPELNWDEQPPSKGHWREDKIGLLLTMTSAVHAVDPCPTIPPAFLDISRIPDLVRQLKAVARASEDAVAEPDEAAESSNELGCEQDESGAENGVAEKAYEPPKLASRQVQATRRRWSEFAEQMAAAAWREGFQKAQRKAFVADGSANNWTLQRRFFGSFEPILDFIHALSYVYAAATAGQGLMAGWSCYEEWIGWVWSGEVSKVIAAIEARQLEVGKPTEGSSATSPESLVERRRVYLSNHQGKMKYAEYRKAGLPLTSSLMESAVKQINQRVKGTEKFWSESGSEAVLQLRADSLSDGKIVEGFLDQRQAEATGFRTYRRSK